MVLDTCQIGIYGRDLVSLLPRLPGRHAGRPLQAGEAYRADRPVSREFLKTGNVRLQADGIAGPAEAPKRRGERISDGIFPPILLDPHEREQ